MRAGEVNAARQAMAELESLLAESRTGGSRRRCWRGCGSGWRRRRARAIRRELKSCFGTSWSSRNVLARAYLRQAQIALGGEHAERGLTACGRWRKTRPAIRRSCIGLSFTPISRRARTAGAGAGVGSCRHERNTRDRDSSGGRRRGREIFADSDNTAEDALALVLEKINEAVRDEKLQEAVGLYTLAD